jgi:hypothetical protein
VSARRSSTEWLLTFWLAERGTGFRQRPGQASGRSSVATSGSRYSGEAALDPEMVEALRNETTRAIARESALLPDRERNLVLGIVRRFEGARSPESADSGASSGGR